MLCVNQIGETVANIAIENNISFTLAGEKMEPEEVFQADGLLALFMREAERVSIEATGRGLGLSWKQDDKSLCGITISLTDEVSATERIAYLVDSMMLMVKEGSQTKTIELDVLFDNDKYSSEPKELEV